MKIEVCVIRVDIDERKIGLSFVHSDFEENKNLEANRKALRLDQPPIEDDDVVEGR